MYEKFERLDQNKQKKIIHVALEEFADKGFADASTNQIVEKAEISKGSLFNYFNNKKDLYIYLLTYSMKIIEVFLKEIDLEEKDLFDRIGNIGIQKLQIHQENPHVFDFLASAELEESVEVKQEIKEKVSSIYNKGIERIYQDIDYSSFRQGIDIEKATEILNWSMFGFGEKVIKQIDTFKDSTEFGKEAIDEWEKYAELLKDAFYQ